MLKTGAGFSETASLFFDLHRIIFFFATPSMIQIRLFVEQNGEIKTFDVAGACNIKFHRKNLFCIPVPLQNPFIKVSTRINLFFAKVVISNKRQFRPGYES